MWTSWSGTADESSKEAGCIWLGSFPPTVWWVRWPDDILQRYKMGSITNSELEMAGIIIKMLILEQLMLLKQHHCHLFSDNTPSDSWTTKLVAKAESVVAAMLLRVLTMRNQVTKAALPVIDHWSHCLLLKLLPPAQVPYSIWVPTGVGPVKMMLYSQLCSNRPFTFHRTHCGSCGNFPSTNSRC
jgi:hypothetical protein